LDEAFASSTFAALSARVRRLTIFSPGSLSFPGFHAGNSAGSGAWKTKDFVETALGASGAAAVFLADEALALAVLEALVSWASLDCDPRFEAPGFKSLGALTGAFFFVTGLVEVSVSSDFFLVTISGVLLTLPQASFRRDYITLWQCDIKMHIEKTWVCGVIPVFGWSSEKSCVCVSYPKAVAHTPVSHTRLYFIG
jgi:hypothetical protein